MSNGDITGRFVWHELMTTDPDGAGEFYPHVVPWKTQDSGMPNYSLWMSGKDRAGGLTVLPEDAAAGTPPHWLIYISTTDVDATIAAAEKAGGKVLKPVVDIPSIGRYAVLADPDGAVFAAFAPQSAAGGEVPSASNVGEFSWHELTAQNPDNTLQFYIKLFGWSKGASHDMGHMGMYQIISHGGQDVGGIYKANEHSLPPSWLSYVRVADATKAAQRAKQAGGKVLHGPAEVPGGSWIVAMLDPQGSAFAVVEQGPTPAAKSASTKQGSPKAASTPAIKMTPTKPQPVTTSSAKASAGKPAPAQTKPQVTATPSANMSRPKTAPAKVSRSKSSTKVAGKAATKATGKTTRKSVRKSAKPNGRPTAKRKAATRKARSRPAAKPTRSVKQGSTRKASAKVGKRPTRRAPAKSKGKRGKRR